MVRVISLNKRETTNFGVVTVQNMEKKKSEVTKVKGFPIFHLTREFENFNYSGQTEES